jgi:hypothetical protein
MPAAKRISSGLALVFGDRRLRIYMLCGWLEALWSVPAALAVPYAASLGGGPAAAGLLFAAAPLGTAAGTAVYGRRARPQHQARLMGPLAVLCCAILAVFVLHPGLAWSLVIITVSGVLGCYQVAANVGFMEALRRRDQQAQAFGIATSGIWTAQGLAYLAAGALADVMAPALVIAVCGAAGAAAAAALAISWRQMAYGSSARRAIPAAAGPSGHSQATVPSPREEVIS